MSSMRMSSSPGIAACRTTSWRRSSRSTGEGKMVVDEARLNEFVGKMIGDMGGAISGALMLVGDRLGLYKALAAGPQSSAELAARTGTAERYVREWLAANAAAG